MGVKNKKKNAKPKEILCPLCKQRAFTYDGISTMNQHARCKSCRKLVCYNPNTDEVTVRQIPTRVSSSGTTYC